jgi:hypothetical protein
MRRSIILLALLGALVGCTEDQQPTVVKPIEVAWKEVTPPLPPGRSGRVAVRDATFCAGEWYVVGGTFDAAGESKPAAWRSRDASTWTDVAFQPGSFWAEQNILSSVACRDGRVAMVGAKSGGAHGNPRTSTWYARPDGVFVDVIAAFSLYGGPEAVNVGRLTSGPTGWLISGNRTSGAAVWISPDATDFTLIDSDPQLKSDPSVDTATRDAVFAGGHWTIVGSGSVPGRIPRLPLSWASDDAKTWRRLPVPQIPEFEDMQRVLPYNGELYAVGLRGNGFGTWQQGAGAQWRAGAAFGALDSAGRAAPFIAGLANPEPGLVTTVSDGAKYGLWASNDGQRWREVATPTRPTTAGEHIMSVAASGHSLLLLADDGQAGRVWLVDAMRYE